MRSIPQALMWEMFSRGRWLIPGMFLLGNVLPLFIFGALSPFEINPNDIAWLVIHITFTLLMLVQFAFGIMAAQGSVSRLYSAPISTSSLVAWHMFPGGVLLAIEYAVAASTYNAVFHASWPILGPALFATTAWCTSQLVISISQRSMSNVIAVCLPCLVLTGWLHSRYGGWFSHPVHYWTEVKPIEILTMLSVVCLSYVVTVKGIARDRCGEPLPSLGTWKWLMKKWDVMTGESAIELQPFRSPADAQLWYEWRLKGPALPTLVIMAYGIVGSLWLLTIAFGENISPRLEQFHQGMLAGGAVFPIIAGIVGLLLGVSPGGNSGRNHAGTIRDLFGKNQLEAMGHFQSTRPLTNSDFAGSFLRMASRSLLIAWGLWIVGFAAWYVLAATTHQVPAVVFPAPFGAWLLPLTLLAPWNMMVHLATVGLTGRGGKMIFIGVGGMMLYVIATILVRQFWSDEILSQVHRICLFAGSIAVLIATPCLFLTALRRNLLSRKSNGLAAAVWLVIVILAIAIRPMDLSLLSYPLILAFSALVILPVATVPLAIAWNRHR